jgi:hypothetical protein
MAGVARGRRTTRVSQQLARARERNNRQLIAIRERELQIDQGIRDYVAATQQIDTADQACQDKVTCLERKIVEARAARDMAVADVRAAQARAVWAIHTAGRTVKQIAELLELSEKAARQLMGRGRNLPSARRLTGSQLPTEQQGVDTDPASAPEPFATHASTQPWS